MELSERQINSYDDLFYSSDKQSFPHQPLSLSLKKCSLSFYRETGKCKILLVLTCLLDRLWPPEEDTNSLSANYSKSGSPEPGYI